MSKGYIGVDFDGTLAFQGGRDWPECGAPVPAMLERVKQWLAEGKNVRIITARAFLEYDCLSNSILLNQEEISKVENWCLEHLGVKLPVTCCKDYEMLALWDDRAVQVVNDTGESLESRYLSIILKLQNQINDLEDYKAMYEGLCK